MTAMDWAIMHNHKDVYDILKRALFLQLAAPPRPVVEEDDDDDDSDTNVMFVFVVVATHSFT